MKITSIILTLFTTLVVCEALTPFTFHLVKDDGTAMTNICSMTPYPQKTYGVTLLGTNIVFGATGINLTPNSNGDGTNFAMPTRYRIFETNSGLGFIVNLPDVTATNPLAIYVEGVPVIYQSSSLFGFITNAIGGVPVISNWPSVLGAIGFQPLTNSYTAISNTVGFLLTTDTLAGITFGLGYTPASNTYSALTNILSFIPATNGGPVAIAQLPYAPATNSFAGIIVALGYNPLTNTYSALVAAAGFIFATNALSYYTTDNPTNAYSVATIYTNTGEKGFLIGSSPSGTVLRYTNNGTGATAFVTNGFSIPLSTNATFRFDAGSLTNAQIWKAK